MDEIKKIEVDGEMYYYYKGRFVDSSFLTLSAVENKKVANQFFGEIDYKSYNFDKLKALVKEAKFAEAFDFGETVCEFILEKYDDDGFLVNNFLPLYTSLLRINKKSQKVIEVYKKYYAKYKCESIPLLTSVAAAYCDLKDREMAIRCARYAYKLQQGGVGFTNELTLVFRRICSEFDIAQEDFFNGDI